MPVDASENVFNTGAVFARGKRQAEAVPVQPHGEQVTSQKGSVSIHASRLRNVANLARARGHRLAVEQNLPRGELLLAQNRPQQAGLARPVRADDGNEFALRHVEVEVAPKWAFVESESRRLDAQHRPATTRGCAARARCVARH